MQAGEGKMALGQEDRMATSKKEDRHLMQKKSHPERISTLQTPTMKRFLILPLFCSLLFGEEPTEIKEGHSHQGHAFNEGPRQASPLIGNTGKVHLPITCSWNQGQAYFNQGLGQLHGFWYYEAERSFRKILSHDPNCAMAYWGLSQANFSNEKRAKEFIAKATELLKKEHFKITSHERAYLDAEIAYHDDKKEKDSKKRIKNFIRAYEDLILNHPDDIEAKALLVCRRWQFNRKGVPISSYLGLDAILEQIFAKEPNHPAHHYAIHLWDNRKHEQALDSAARLGKTAPGIAHMWHMPGHIYSKAKRYHDAVFSQQSSARVDHAHMAKHFLIPDQIHNYAHNNEWLARNFGHLGDAPAAVAMAKSLLANPRHPKLNTLEGRSHSYKYGRNNLLKTLEKFELWEETFELSNTQWLETLPKQPAHDRARLRLIGIANFYLGHRVELMQIINQVEGLLADEKAKKQVDEDKAKEKATKEKKKEGEIKKAVAEAGKKYNRLIGSLEKDCAELLGYLAEMNDDEKTARESLAKSSGSATFKALRELQFGNKEAAEKAARSVLDGDKKETVSLANAITLFHRMGKKEDAKKGFEKLRVFSSEVDLKSRPFARLAPIAKEFGYPADWRQAHKPDDDLLPRPDLGTLGPLHWTPPAAPAFSLPDQHQKKISSSSIAGKPHILVFYLGAGCLHCAEQLTAMADRYSDFKKAKLPILAISTDKVAELKKSQDNYEKGDIPFPIVSDHQKEIFKKFSAHDDFENQPLHGTFLVDGKSRVLWADVSADPFMEIDFLIKESNRLLELHR